MKLINFFSFLVLHCALISGVAMADEQFPEVLSVTPIIERNLIDCYFPCPHLQNSVIGYKVKRKMPDGTIDIKVEKEIPTGFSKKGISHIEYNLWVDKYKESNNE